jgi:hypothetical protein
VLHFANATNRNVGWRGGNRTHSSRIKSPLLGLLSFAPIICWGDRRIRTDPLAFTVRCAAATPRPPLILFCFRKIFLTAADVIEHPPLVIEPMHTAYARYLWAATRILRYASRAQLAKLPFAATQPVYCFMPFNAGCPGWIRTRDRRLNRAPLYRLSYWAIDWQGRSVSNQDNSRQRRVLYH